MKLLVSGCLLGENVRYDGKNSGIKEPMMQRLKDGFEIYSFCPEVSGGMPTPRVPSEIISMEPLKVINKEKEDTTHFFIKGAKNCLEFCKDNGIKIALFKSRSPSCGNRYVHGGKFNKKLVEGKGVTVTLLNSHGIKVFNEEEIKELFEYKNTKC